MIVLAQALTIAAKELRETIRDRRTLLVMIGIPVLLYPLLSIGVTQVVNMQMASLREQKIRLAVVGDDRGLLGALVTDLRVEHVTTYQGKPIDAEVAAQALRDKAIDVALVAAPGPADQPLGLELRYTITEDRSSTARARLVDMLERVYLSGAARELERRAPGLTLDRIAPLRLKIVNVDPDLKGGFVFGRLIALLLVTLAVTFPFHPALDLTAGEKERGTLETLLVSPAGRREIVVGKYMAILTIGFAASVVNLVSMALTFDQFAGMTKNMSEATDAHERRFQDADAKLGPAFSFSEPERKGALDVGLSIGGVAKILAALIPLVALFSAAALALSALARSYKEGQNYLTPLLVVVMPLSMVAMIPNIDLTMANAWVPVSNVVLLVRDLFLGKLQLGPFLMVVASTSALALVALAVAVAVFEREEVLFREAGARKLSLRPKACTVPPAPVAMIAVAISVILTALVGPRLQLKLLEAWGAERLEQVLYVYFAGSMLTVAALACGAITFARARWAPSLGLYAPRGGAAVAAAAVALGVGGSLVAAPLTEWLIKATGQEQQLHELERSMAPIGAMPLGLQLLLLALLPAVCEELLFRGVVLRSLLDKFKAPFAIAVSAALFAVNHVMLFKLPPTFAAGLLAGWLAWRSRSVLPGMLFHLAWNATPFLLLASEDHAPALPDVGVPEVGFAWLPWAGAGLALAAYAGAQAAFRRADSTGGGSGSSTTP